MLRRRNPFPVPAMTRPVAGRHRAAMTEQDMGGLTPTVPLRFASRADAWYERPSLAKRSGLYAPPAEAGEGAEIVDGLTGQVIERLPPQRN